MSRSFEKLRNIAEVVMGQSPSGDTYNEKGIGLPLLNGPTEFGVTHPFPKLYTIDSKREGKENDLIFCVRGSTTGRMNWADQVYSLGRGVCTIRGKQEDDTKFIKYCIENRLNELLQIAGGGTFPNLKKDDILDFHIPFPENKDKIASILSAYDDLIENNLKRIKLLEEAAQNIYKEWFVHFRFPGYETAKFGEDGLPEGWEMKTLSELCISIEDGDWIESKDQSGSAYRLIQVSNIGVDSFIETNKWRWITEDTFHRLRCREIEEGDLIVSRMPNDIGRSWLAEKKNFKMITVVDVAIVKPNLNLTSRYYLNVKFNTLENIQICESLAGGTTRKRISKKNLASIQHTNPDKKTLDNFDRIISPIYELKNKLYTQNQFLKEARDILLPRLMDRRIEV